MNKNANNSWRFDATLPTYASQIKEIFQFSDLLPMLFVRSLFRVREKAMLGVGWLVIQIAAMAVPMVLLVGPLLKLDTAQLPPTIFILSGLAPWLLFRNSAQMMSKSFNMHKFLLRSFNVPPFILMISTLSIGVFAFAIGAIILTGAVLYNWIDTGNFLFDFGWKSLWAIPALAVIIMVAVGFSCFTSILGYVLADVAIAIRYLYAVWLFTAPIFYSFASLDEAYRVWFYFNPISGPVELFRWSFFDVQQPEINHVLISLSVGFVVFIAGIAFFLKFQRKILDFA